MRLVVLAGALFLFTVSANASMVEDASSEELSYQFDGDTFHDAPDACEGLDSAFDVDMGSSTDGMLVPGDDASDHFVFDVPAELVGVRLHVWVSEDLAGPDVDLMALAPLCNGDVFAAQNVPAPFPSPAAPASGEVQTTVQNLAGSWDCDASTWKFVVTHLEQAKAPTTMHVAWTDGTEMVLALVKQVGAVAHYETTFNTDTTLTNAWANLPTNWAGTFRIGYGPCTATDGGAVYGDAPEAGDDIIHFTPIKSGLHVARVTLAPPSEPEAKAVPMSCHFCLGSTAEGLAQNVSYKVGVYSG